MSFWRHEEIYRSDVGLGEARNGNGCRRSPHSSAAMSFQSAIPQQVALQQCLPLLHRLQTILNNQCCRTMILQRTATTPLTPCLSSRVHSKLPASHRNVVIEIFGRQGAKVAYQESLKRQTTVDPMLDLLTSGYRTSRIPFNTTRGECCEMDYGY